jgi:AP-4 complex subunit beta-1
MVKKLSLKKYKKIFETQNLLEDRLKHACTSIVLGCIKVFLNYTIEKPQLHQQVFKRIQSPLITLMTSGEVNGLYELTFTVLSHIYFIVTR